MFEQSYPLLSYGVVRIGHNAMDYNEGRDKFIETWGRLAGSWGVPKTMAQIHALLLITTQPMCADEVISQLDISRGNANMNLRELVEWGLVVKESKDSGRKEYFVAEKNIWEVFRMIAVQRKKRELEPVVRALDELTQVDANCPDSEAFIKMVRDLKYISSAADALIDRIIQKESVWLLNGLSKLTR